MRHILTCRTLTCPHNAVPGSVVLFSSAPAHLLVHSSGLAATMMHRGLI